MFFDLSRDKTSFAVTVRRLIIKYPIASVVCGPELLLFLVDIVRNYGVGRIQNCLCRAIVLFKQNDLCLWEMMLKFEDVPDVGLSKTVNALRVVSDHADILLLLSQEFDERELQRIRVLIFVDQDVF